MKTDNLDQILIITATTMLAIIAGSFLVVSIILNYHWNRYGDNKKGIKRTKRIYTGISITLFIIMAIAYMFMLYD